jgi:hypothetical protein
MHTLRAIGVFVRTTKIKMADATYRFAAYVPDPRGGDNNFTYDDLVTVPASLTSASAREVIVNALPDHIFLKTKVRVDPQYIVVQLFELADQDTNSK